MAKFTLAENIFNDVGNLEGTLILMFDIQEV